MFQIKKSVGKVCGSNFATVYTLRVLCLITVYAGEDDVD